MAIGAGEWSGGRERKRADGQIKIGGGVWWGLS